MTVEEDLIGTYNHLIVDGVSGEARMEWVIIK
jgi:hypothetical protein